MTSKVQSENSNDQDPDRVWLDISAQIVSIAPSRDGLLYPRRYILCDLLPPGLCDNPVCVIIELPIRGDSLVFFRHTADDRCGCDPVLRARNDQHWASHF